MTNFERIKQMSAEEMKCILCSFCFSEEVTVLPFCDVYKLNRGCDDSNCIVCIEEWLNKEEE